MNQAQKVALLIGCLVISAMAIYPPWLMVEPKEAPYSMGYSFIWNPPTQPRDARLDIFGIKIEMDLEPVAANKIDFSKLFTQFGAVAIVMAGVILLLRRKAMTAGKNNGASACTTFSLGIPRYLSVAQPLAASNAGTAHWIGTTAHHGSTGGLGVREVYLGDTVSLSPVA